MGDPSAWLLVVGLAPGANGANRTGRPFTGDLAGAILYRALHEAGLASVPDPEAENPPMRLTGVMVTNVARCVPEDDSLEPGEIANCRRFFHGTLDRHSRTVTDILCIGKTTPFPEVKRYLGLTGKRGAPKFVNGGFFREGRYRIWMSFHTSRRNMNTGIISQESFSALVRRIVDVKSREG